MRSFAFAAIVSAVAAECFESTDEMGNYNRTCDGEWVECSNNCWMDGEVERCETWCWENDSPLEEALDDIADALEEFGEVIMNPERAMEEFGRELEHLSEDIECWWASRSPETSCAMWERWAAQEECDMRMDGSRWNWEEQWCMDRDSVYNFEYSRCMDDMSEGVDEWGCSADWYENEWYDETDPWSQRGWCNWQCENNEDKLVLAKDIKMTKDSGLTSYLTHFAKNDSKKMHAIRMLQSMDSEMTISVDLDLAELESIGLENEAVMQQNAEVLGMFGESVNELMEGWAPVLEQMAMETQRRNEEIAQRLAELIGSSIYVNGMPLSDMMGMNESPEQWLMKRRVAGARDVRSLFALNNVVLADFEGDMSDMVDPPMPSNVSFDISFDEQEAMEAFESLMMNVEWVKSDVENALNDFFMSVGDAAEQLEDSMEYSNSTQALSESVNNLGDMLKEATMDIEPVFSLAQKKPKAAQQTNYAKTAAGATFGVIALASVIALARSNKKTADNQESLL